MTRITVIGVGLERAPAERARITVRSRVRRDRPEEAIDAVAAAHARIIAEVRDLEAAGVVESWHADRIAVQHGEEWHADGQERRTVFEAMAGVESTFGDIDAVGAWLGRIAARPEHEVDPIGWLLSDATTASLGTRARHAAIADAVARAADYAAAAGLASPAIVRIREVGSDGAGMQQPRPAALVRAAASVVELTGTDVTVTSEIRVDLEA